MSEGQLIHQIRSLSVAERIVLVEDVWKSIRKDSDDVPLTASQKKELDRRLAHAEKEGESGEPWSAVKARMANRRRG